MKKIYRIGALAVLAVFSALSFSGCGSLEYVDDNLSSEGEVMSLEEAYYIEITDPKYQTCYAMPDTIPPLCSDQPSSDIVLAQDLMDYMYARTGEQPYLFMAFEETSKIVPDPIPLDENQTMASAPSVPILMDLEREVSCIHYVGDDRAVNIDKFKCLVEKYSDG